MRKEKDTLGEIHVPADCLWGAQTQRSLSNFKISVETIPPELIRAIILIKKAAAMTNLELKVLEERIGKAIINAADQLLADDFKNHFPLSVWQTGSGTQTNMNCNEVLSIVASRNLTNSMAPEDRPVHPNDHVNCGQSSNDTIPTAMHVAAVEALEDQVIPGVRRLHSALKNKVEAFSQIVKIGRTHLQDATPLTLGQEFSGYVSMLDHSGERIRSSLPHLYELAQGGTAVGTGLNTHPLFAAKMAERISKLTGRHFVTAPNKFEALAARDGLVFSHGTLKNLAVSLNKIANDVRLLASGPRCGIGEIELPANEPGSSIMPGKVNPTQCEMLTMVCAQVFGNDVTVTHSGASGQFELNVFKPVIIYNFLQSCRILADGMESFRKNCILGIRPNKRTIKKHLRNSLMLVTALCPYIGYENSARIAKYAFEHNTTLRDAALHLRLTTKEQFDQWVIPENMTGI